MLRDTLYYKVLPVFLRTMERLETAGYKRQKLNIRPQASLQGNNRLFLTHGRGGGVDKYVETAAAAIEAEGKRAWILHFHPIKRCFILSRGLIHAEQSQIFRFPNQYAQMVSHLQSLNIGLFHIHHIRYLPFCLMKDLPELAHAIAPAYDYMMHDFIALCPRVHLIDANFSYCGMPKDVSICNRCVKQNGFLTTAPDDTGVWRAICARLLQKAQTLIAPSHDTALRHQRILGPMEIQVIPHDAPEFHTRYFSPKSVGAPYVVAVVGRIHRHKGAQVLLACAEDARKRNLPLQFAVIGDSAYDKPLRAAGVSITGVYKEADLPALLQKSGASVAFFPSIWPETYSYVLSQILENSYFPVAFDLGAPAERIKALNKGIVLPFDMVKSPGLINDALLGAARAQHTH